MLNISARDIRPVQLPRLKQMSDRIELNLNKLMNYRYRSPSVLNSKHPLVRLCYLVDSASETLIDVIKYIKQNHWGIISSLRLTSQDSPGTVQSEAWLYSLNDEYVMATINADPFEVDAQWETYPSLEVQYHDQSDTVFAEMLGNGTYSLLKIDIMALAVQLFNHKKKERALASESPQHLIRNFEWFANAHIVTNAVPSHTNICLFNRYLTDTPTILNQPVYFLPPLETTVDNYQDDMADYIDADPSSVGETLAKMTLRTGVTADTLFDLPDVSGSTQCNWWLRLASVQWLIDLALKNTLVDRQFHTQVKTEYLRWKSDRSGNMVLKEQFETALEKYAMLLDLVG